MNWPGRCRSDCDRIHPYPDRIPTAPITYTICEGCRKSGWVEGPDRIVRPAPETTTAEPFWKRILRRG